MFARAFGCAVVCLALLTVGTQGGDKGGKKGEAKEVVGKLKSVDADKGSLTLSPAAGKDRTFKVTEDTKFVGPMGGKRGTGKAGLKDDALKPGATVRVVPAAKDANTAAEVHLPKKASQKKKK